MRSLISILTLAFVAALATPSFASMVTSGAAVGENFQEIDVYYSRLVDQYIIEKTLVHDSDANPMIKHFHGPQTNAGETILLDKQNRHPLKITENWYLNDQAGSGSAAYPRSEPVSDWHERFMTPGFVWVIPGDSEFTELFSNSPSLITENGSPHPWADLDQSGIHPTGYRSDRIDVEFSAIKPGDILDIHKAILWVGTSDNSIWGDNKYDDGRFLDESTIEVMEYPTPEPATAAMLLMGGLVLLRRR